MPSYGTRTIHPLLLLVSIVGACGSDADDVDGKAGSGGGANIDGGAGVGGVAGGGGADAGTAADADAGSPDAAGGHNFSTSALGIPAPPFGIDEVPEMYKGQPGFSNAGGGPYTHYVDNSKPCDDSGNGTEANPRCTIPAVIPAKSVVEVHGGPYVLSKKATMFTFAGSAAEPAFLRAVGSVIFDSEGERFNVEFRGSYGIVDGFKAIGGATFRLGDAASHHMSLRNSEVDYGDGNCLAIRGKYMVAYRNLLQHCHRGNGFDAHGCNILGGTANIWVLENTSQYNFGNGVMWGHGASTARPTNIFIGSNQFVGNRESGVASKFGGKDVISGNVISLTKGCQVGIDWCAADGSYCEKPTESCSNGPGIVTGADGEPEQEWVMWNVIHDSAHCIRLEEAGIAYYIGNICFDIDGPAIRFEKRGHGTVLAHNTWFDTNQDSTGAMVLQDWRDKFTNMRIHNNVFDTTGNHLLWFEDLSGSGVVGTMQWNSNIHYNGGANFTIDWKGSKTISNLSDLSTQMAGKVSTFTGNIVGDPKFVNRSKPDFALAPNSPAIGAATSILKDLDAIYKAEFGNNLTIIPNCWSDGNYDIGAICAD